MARIEARGLTVGWEIANKIVGSLPLGMPAVHPALVGSVVMLVGISFLGERSSEGKWRPFFD